MNYKDAVRYYKKIKEEFSNDNEKFEEFYEYFEDTWFSMMDPDSSKYKFKI